METCNVKKSMIRDGNGTCEGQRAKCDDGVQHAVECVGVCNVSRVLSEMKRKCLFVYNDGQLI
jgi:hypothetical protein